MNTPGTTLPPHHAHEGHGARPGHGRRAQEPGFSMLRTSLAMRLAIVAGCAAVLWSAVWVVLA